MPLLLRHPLHDATRCDATQHDAMRRDATRHGVRPCSWTFRHTLDRFLLAWTEGDEPPRLLQLGIEPSNGPEPSGWSFDFWALASRHFSSFWVKSLFVKITRDQPRPNCAGFLLCSFMAVACCFFLIRQLAHAGTRHRTHDREKVARSI